MKLFATPEIEVVNFAVEDIITTSTIEQPDCDNELPTF